MRQSGLDREEPGIAADGAGTVPTKHEDCFVEWVVIHTEIVPVRRQRGRMNLGPSDPVPEPGVAQRVLPDSGVSAEKHDRAEAGVLGHRS